jgi:hypothetical protein
MQKNFVESRESLYVLSIELVILYLVAFGLLSLKTDNMFSVGMAYPAVLFTFLLAYLLQTFGLLSGALGLEVSHHAAMACARGAALFVCAAFLLLLVLVVSLWSSPMVCVYDEADATASCYGKGDSVWQRKNAAEVRFGFPSRTEYLAYMELANTTVADVFLKTSLSENDLVTKLSAVIALPVAFVIFVVQNSFFYTIYGIAEHTQDDTTTGVGLFSLFVRCVLLLLTVVIDSVDIFADWNVVDVGPQMLPSLAFTSLLILGDFCGTIVEQTMEIWDKEKKHQNVKHKLGLLACLASAMVSGMYVLFALIIAVHYLVGGLTPLRDFIADTRWTTVHILFVMFIITDAFMAFGRVLWKARKYVVSGTNQDTPKSTFGLPPTTPQGAAFAALAYDSNSPPFGASIDVDSVFGKSDADKKFR